MGRERGNPLYVYLTLAYFGAIASANADTWATELGVLSRTPPRLITTGKPVAPGTSGGVTWYGTVAALAGSAFIGVAAFVLIQGAALATRGTLLLSDLPLIWIASLAGLVFIAAVAGDGVFRRCPTTPVDASRVDADLARAAALRRFWRRKPDPEAAAAP